MRISDWSSDVCSSDLKTLRHGHVIDAVSVGIRSVDIVERQLHAVVHVEPALRLADQAQIGIVDHDMQVRQLELRADRELLDHELEVVIRSDEHTSEIQSLMRISHAVFCLKKITNYIFSVSKNGSVY